jgi:hypothetical protein
MSQFLDHAAGWVACGFRASFGFIKRLHVVFKVTHHGEFNMSFAPVAPFQDLLDVEAWGRSVKAAATSISAARSDRQSIMASEASAIVSRASNIEEAKVLLDRDGICVMENILDATGLARVKKALFDGVARDGRAGVPVRGFHFDPDARNLRVFDLIGKDPVFAELVEHPIAVELVRHAIGAPFSLSNFSANVTAPGSGAMGMHADQGYVPAPWHRIYSLSTSRGHSMISPRPMAQRVSCRDRIGRITGPTWPMLPRRCRSNAAPAAFS